MPWYFLQSVLFGISQTPFTKTVDWSLIEMHFMDTMQVVLSIQAGIVLPPMLLRKLNSNNSRNKLYRTFRELDRVISTLFLLQYISESKLRWN
ncbi:MAG: Tn3 family transposase [Gammaproteobacteria bacterium]|nr:Tn3 family transposase [Gammaproteobacteria bacterium]